MYESFVTIRQNTIKHECIADKFLKSLVYKWNPLLSKWFITALDKTGYFNILDLENTFADNRYIETRNI